MNRNKTIIDADHITCGRCGYCFDRDKINKHCSNCFACTGCEIYYCPSCEEEIIITPRKPVRQNNPGNNGSGD